MKVYTLRTRFKAGIISEFTIPSRPGNRVIILCSGMPSYPSAKDLMFYLSSLGYYVFLPRYRGSWESEGKMFASSPHLDVIKVIDGLSTGFFDLWSGKKFRIVSPKVFLIGSSFGGAAVILASLDKRVKKAVALSPVIDWRKEGEEEPLEFLAKFTAQAFGQGYRIDRRGWDKIKSGKFFNPIQVVSRIDGKKIKIIQARDDKVVPFLPAQQFARLSGCDLLLRRQGGHLGLSSIKKKRLLEEILRFISV